MVPVVEGGERQVTIIYIGQHATSFLEEKGQRI